MIDQSIREQAQSFILFANQQTAGYPQLKLDLTWPSIGTLDLLLFPFRKKESLAETEETLLDGATSYLAIIAYDCWSTFPDKLELNLTQEAPQLEIVLSAKGGQFLSPREKFLVNISKSLRKVLLSPEDPFPVFADLKRTLPEEHNLISLFASGLVTGLCPYGEGPWKNYSLEEFAPYLTQAHSYLAESSAGYYQQTFPQEEVVHTAETFLSNLILPPAEYLEMFPAGRAVEATLDYLLSENVSETNIRRFALNLISTPDELLSSVGFAIAVASSEERRPANAVVYSQSLPAYAFRLRPAVMIAREKLGGIGDWVKAAEEKNYGAARKLIPLGKIFQSTASRFLRSRSHRG